MIIYIYSEKYSNSETLGIYDSGSNFSWTEERFSGLKPNLENCYGYILKCHPENLPRNAQGEILKSHIPVKVSGAELVSVIERDMKETARSQTLGKRARNKPLTQQQLDEATKLHEMGNSWAEIAKGYGVSSAALKMRVMRRKETA